jgi:hypothetical protein
MKFKLEISLGNDAMQTAGDVVEALRTLASQLELLPQLEILEDMDAFDTTPWAVARSHNDTL